MPSVFTIIQNEPVFFPLWYDHYSKHFAPGEIYVLHHILPHPQTSSQEARKNSWDEFISKHHRDHGYNLVPLTNEQSFDHHWLKSTVEQHQRMLISISGWTLFAEVDEIIFPHPGLGLGLKEYADKILRAVPTAVCNGYEVVHKIDEEPPIDLSIPILAQRKWWYHSYIYSKPLLSRIPLSWVCGFHSCKEIPLPHTRIDPLLYMIHLHKMDWKICLDRHISNIDRRLCEDRMGFQNRIADETRLREWWFQDIDTGMGNNKLEEIPQEFKSII